MKKSILLFKKKSKENTIVHQMNLGLTSILHQNGMSKYDFRMLI